MILRGPRFDSRANQVTQGNKRMISPASGRETLDLGQMVAFEGVSLGQYVPNREGSAAVGIGTFKRNSLIISRLSDFSPLGIIVAIRQATEKGI